MMPSVCIPSLFWYFSMPGLDSTDHVPERSQRRYFSRQSACSTDDDDWFVLVKICHIDKNLRRL
jgi:hypothetical protein